MKSYLIRQGIFYFVDGSLSCPLSHVVVAYGFSRVIIFFLRYKQQDELILSALLFFSFNECTASCCHFPNHTLCLAYS